MFTIIRNEVRKVFAQRRMYIFLGLITCVLLFPAIYSKLFPNGRFKEFNFTGQNLPMFMLEELLSEIIGIFTLLIIAWLISDEFTNGTIKLSLLRPISRSAILLSRVIAYAVALFLLLIFCMISSYILGTLFFGWGKGLQIADTLYSTPEGIFITVRSYLLAFIPNFAFGMVMLFVSMLLNNSISVVGVGFGIGFVLNIAIELMDTGRDLIISAHLNNYQLFISHSDASKIIGSYIIIFAYLVVFLSASILAFNRKDILI